jgi:hypothetical protein
MGGSRRASTEVVSYLVEISIVFFVFFTMKEGRNKQGTKKKVKGRRRTISVRYIL